MTNLKTCFIFFDFSLWNSPIWSSGDVVEGGQGSKPHGDAFGRFALRFHHRRIHVTATHLGLEPCSHVLPDLLLEARNFLLSKCHICQTDCQTWSVLAIRWKNFLSFVFFPTFLKALKRFPKLFSEIRVLAAAQSVGLPKRRATISMTIRTKLGGLPKFRNSKMSFLDTHEVWTSTKK